MLKTIGWINIILILAMLSIYPIKKINLHLIKQKSSLKDTFRKFYRFIIKAHPIVGIIIILLGLYHGYNAYSLTAFYSGTILLYWIVLMGIVAIIGQKISFLKKQWRIYHRIMGFLALVFSFIHIYYPNLF